MIQIKWLKGGLCVWKWSIYFQSDSRESRDTEPNQLEVSKKLLFINYSL